MMENLVDDPELGPHDELVETFIVHIPKVTYFFMKLLPSYVC